MSWADDAVERATHVADDKVAHGRVAVADLTHSAVRGQLSDYLDRVLDDGDRRRLDHHLDDCRDCSAYLATLRRTVELARGLPSAAAPDGAKASIIDRARAQ